MKNILTTWQTDIYKKQTLTKNIVHLADYASNEDNSNK